MNATIRRISPEEYAASRWSGGTTTQIAIAPAGAVYAERDFLWRVSSATVELETSDFTPLPDYERFLSTLRGTIRLTHGEEALELNPGSVHRFDGGAPTRSEGICTDFNLMLRKGRCAGQMVCLRLGEGGVCRLSQTVEATAEKRVFLVYCAEGDGELSAEGTGVRFAAGEAALAENAEPLLRCASASTFLICEIAEIA
ncbi:HutD family protein [Oscillibacter sp.]|uniref:HutD/Ves family protein n=2 Tax=unclassified Oscillibacter TaxID=2629304 RepID=UPI0028989764|nr:HutD family protein [Oscillibacter sp.]